MKVFVDTNVLLDFMCRREPYYTDVYAIFRKAVMREYDIVVSALTIVNAQYTAKKYGLATTDVSSIIKNLLTLVSVSSITEEMVRYAYSVDDKDKEDVLQFMSAKSVGADIIVSRDKKGFVHSPIRVFSPREFLNQMATDNE